MTNVILHLIGTKIKLFYVEMSEKTANDQRKALKDLQKP